MRMTGPRRYPSPTAPAGRSPRPDPGRHPRRPRRCLATVLPTVALTVVLAGCAQHPAPAGDALLRLSVPAQVTVAAHPVGGLGVVLTDAAGRTLYMFPPDAGGHVTCTGGCAGTWPPLVTASNSTPMAGPGVNPADLGTLVDPNSGAAILTYTGYPLYRYAGDLGPGTANGQGLFLNGGPWYALSPDGNPVTNPVTTIPTGPR